MNPYRLAMKPVEIVQGWLVSLWEWLAVHSVAWDAKQGSR